MINIRTIVFSFIFVLFFCCNGITQHLTKNDTVHINKKRLYTVVGAETFAFAGSIFFFNKIWYKDFPRTSFHFFNDNNEWLQMDKFGHTTTSYNIGQLGYSSLKWAGVEDKKAIWYGGSLGTVYLLTIEFFDGFSSKWGFSTGDFVADVLGSAVFMSQQFTWKEQRINFKWSYHPTKYPDLRPDLLGKDYTQSWVKDYNGQTYWLSSSISSFMDKQTKFPKWLNIAIGYGAEGMIGGTTNPSSHNGKILPYFTRYRQFYLAPNIDFTKINTHSPFLKKVFFLLSFLKFPTPTLEYSKETNLKVRAFYF